MTDLIDDPATDPVADEDRDRFRELYAQLYPSVFSYAYQLLRDEEAARDVAQEAFVALFSRWTWVRKPRPYLFRTVTLRARSVWKASYRDRSLPDWMSDRHHAVPGPDLSVADAVNRLPSRHREIVLLFYYADLPLSDVARAVRRPEGTVKRMLSEAREQLAVSLGDPYA